MKVIAIEKKVPGVKAEDFPPHLKDEAKKVWELYQQGVIREIYLRQDVTEAVLVLEVADIKEANKVLDSLPLVKKKLIAFEVIPLKAYPGFSRLFG